MELIKKILQSKIFRYFISAGLATWVDITIYFLAYNYIYQKEDFSVFGLIMVSAPTASLILSYTCGLITNFFVTKWLVFHDSDLETHKQLFRYVLVAILILFLNYFLMNFLIHQFEWYPTIARAFSAVTIGLFSFVIHRSFSFQVKKS